MRRFYETEYAVKALKRMGFKLTSKKFGHVNYRKSDGTHVRFVKRSAKTCEILTVHVDKPRRWSGHRTIDINQKSFLFKFLGVIREIKRKETKEKGEK